MSAEAAEITSPDASSSAQSIQSREGDTRTTSETAGVDVLIVGAGPSGMLLAAALHRHGVRFRIVDRDEGPTDLTRAPVLWQRTQEILAALSIREDWLPESGEMGEECLHFYGRYAGALPMSAPSSPFTKALYAGQDVTERLLDAHLRQLGVAMEYGKELVSYSEDPDRASVTLRDRLGVEERTTARWVVSAEGSHSLVRHALGLDFEGEKYIGFRIHIADVHVHWTVATPPGQTFFMVEKHGYLGGQRMPGHPDRFYFYILTVDDRPGDSSNELSLEEAQRLVRQFSGDDAATLAEPRWLNTARYRHGLARTYAQGRAFLIGDAARSAPPLYGQGMNYAMQDAWNLAWKLAHVVKGRAQESLLGTFTDERRKVGADLDERIDGTFRFITEPKPLQASLVKAAAPVMLSSDRVKGSLDERFTEVTVDYAGVGLSVPSTSLGGLTSGDRAPAVWVKRLPECVHTNLLDLYDGVRWTLLVIAPAGSEPARARPLVEDALARQAAHPDTVRAALLSTGPRRPHPLLLETVVDAQGRLVTEHKLPETGLLLVRPDGYIGWAGRDAVGLDDYLARWLVPSPDIPLDARAAHAQ